MIACSGVWSYLDPTCWGYMAGQAAGDIYTGKVPVAHDTGSSAGDFFNQYAPADVPVGTGDGVSSLVAWLPIILVGGVVLWMVNR